MPLGAGLLHDRVNASSSLDIHDGGYCYFAAMDRSRPCETCQPGAASKLGSRCSTSAAACRECNIHGAYCPPSGTALGMAQQAATTQPLPSLKPTLEQLAPRPLTDVEDMVDIGKGPIFGGPSTKAAFAGWLGIWRGTYCMNNGSVPELPDSNLPGAFRGVNAKVVVSSGGAAGGIVSEGIGYGILIEGIQAAQGSQEALGNALALTRSWLGMVYGPASVEHPYAGGGGDAASATDVGKGPYGVSAIASSTTSGGPAGLPAWKFPTSQCYPRCHGSATDGDEDAVLGMIYMADALRYPSDFMDMVVRSVIAFASADLGFPDLYRTLPDGTKMYVPKGGSAWGGLTPPHGRFKTSQQPWCYNPSYFAPGHYRVFRDFLKEYWEATYDSYLPPHLDGSPTSLDDLTAAFNGAIVAGYNILYRSSCSSGAVGNWVGVKSTCWLDAMSCPGVPWADTPYVGTEGTCSASGTSFGSYGPDASRTPWRIAMDYILYTEESGKVPMYDRQGYIDTNVDFNAQTYLNRISDQYQRYSQCDGGKPGGCIETGNNIAAYKVSAAFVSDTPGLTCNNVPNSPEGWWSAFMAHPTFTAFVAPSRTLRRVESSSWQDTFASLCAFTGLKPTGSVCSTNYFELSQEVVASMLMAGALSTPVWASRDGSFPMAAEPAGITALRVTCFGIMVLLAASIVFVAAYRGWFHCTPLEYVVAKYTDRQRQKPPRYSPYGGVYEQPYAQRSLLPRTRPALRPMQVPATWRSSATTDDRLPSPRRDNVPHNAFAPRSGRW